MNRQLSAAVNLLLLLLLLLLLQAHVLRRGLLARREWAEQLSRHLIETTASPEVDISSPISR
jgi:hypothetical protein